MKAIYGLKQATKAWHDMLHKFLMEIGFVRSYADNCLYLYRERNVLIILIVYVEDIKIAGNDGTKVTEIVDLFSHEYTIRVDKGDSKFLGTPIFENDDYVQLHHQIYITDLLAEYNMTTCKPAHTPLPSGLELSSKSTEDGGETMEKRPYQQLIGSLLYLENTTRPDISYAVSYLLRFMSNPTTNMWTSAKYVLRYLKGTSGYGLRYPKDEKSGNELLGFSDSDWAEEKPSRKSISG